jgi:hypothetical protein
MEQTMWEPVYLLDIIFNIGGEDSLGSLGNFGNFGNIMNRCNWTSFLTLVEKIVLGHWETLGTLGT